MIFLPLFTALVCLPFPAFAIDFSAVPTACEKVLRVVQDENAFDRRKTIDWAPWAAHLIWLGYDADFVPAVMNEGVIDPDKALASLRSIISNPTWSWRDGLTKEESRLVGTYYPEGLIPFEYLAHVNGFNPGEALRGRLAREPYLKINERRRLARCAPFWIGEGADLARSFLAKNESITTKVDAYRWLKQMVPEDERSALRTLLLEEVDEGMIDPETLYVMLSDLPLTAFPAPDRRYLRSQYFQSEREATPASNIRTVSHGLDHGGDCREMTFGHVGTLLSREPQMRSKVYPHEPPLVIRVDGRVVGLVKRHGNASMLSLVTQRNAEGQYPLIKGGVYRVSREINDLPKRPVGRRRWPLVDVGELRVRPVGPVLNEFSWMIRNASLIAILMGGSVQRNFETVLHEIVATGEFDDPDIGNLRPRLHRRVWANLMMRIDAERAELDRF